MKSFLALSLASLALASPVPDTTSSPPAFKINNIVSGGSGCPQGSINIDYTDSGILPILFGKDFTATVGPDVTADQSRKNCQINIDISYSPGWSYSVYSADYKGYAVLDSGVKGYMKSTYYFSGETAQGSSAIGFSGPYTGVYTKHDDVGVSVWSPCGSEALLNVNAEVALTPLASANSGTLGIIKETGKLTNQLYIKWKQC